MNNTKNTKNSILLSNVYNSPMIEIEKENGIAYFFEYEAKKDTSRVRLPDGSIEISFLLNQPSSFYLSGPYDLIHHVNYPDSGTVFGIFLLPSLVPEPWNHDYKFSDFSNRTIVFDCKDYPAFQAIFVATDFVSRMEIARSLLSTSIYFNGNNLLNYISHQIYINKGNIHLSNLYREIGYTRQYINQLFKSEIGVKPKYFCKILRFQYLIYCISAYYPEKRLNYIVKMCGYYDQSHMNKEFREFTNLNPDAFIKKYRKILNQG